ncbi:hypothetical protein Gpo141_00009805 [Globisporangium polare]
MARVQSAGMFDDDHSWSQDDSESKQIPHSAILQPQQSPRPLLEERRRGSSSSGKARRRPKTRTDTANHQELSDNTPSRHVQVSDRQLAEIARRATGAIDWDNLRAGRSSVWDKKTTLGDFGIYTRRSSKVHHIMASGSVACSIAEMQHILCTTTSARYECAMQELHGDSFLSGEVVHRVNTRLATASTSTQDLGNSTCDARARGCFDLAVKTATFAKAHVFARQEHWCFLDFFQPQADKKKFLLTMHSLLPEDVLLPVATSSISRSDKTQQTQQLPTSTNQLQEMSAGYSVVADDRRGLVWIVFYAQYVDPDSSSTASKLFFKSSPQGGRQLASKSTITKRLMKMAKATCCLPMIVRRRHLGVQVLVDTKAFTPPNTHCICCTTALSLLTSKSQRCRLCGYCVCDRCSSKQQIERAHSHMPSVRVCLTCARRVNGANYDNLPTGAISPTAIQKDAPGAVPANKLLADLLRDSFENAVNDDRKRAVIQVVKSLLEQQQEESFPPPPSSADSLTSTQSSADYQQSLVNKQRRTRTESQTTTTTNQDQDFLDALDTDLYVKPFALDECVLGNTTTREYPLTYKDESEMSPPNFPIPANEEHRLGFVKRQRRLSDIKNVPELEIICSIARKELQCSAGVVTVVDRGEVHVIASSDAAFQNLVVPRDESICAHTIMSDKPLLLPHAGADIRFNRMTHVQGGGVSFYCGFPLITSDNQVIGTVCCMDTQDHDVTQAQYAVMIKLASTATRVMEMRANANAA